MRMDVSPRPPSIPAGVSIRLEDLLDQVHSLRYASSPKPWLDTEGNFLWSRGRINAARVVLSQAFETCMGLIILANLGLLAFEANQDAKCYPSYAETFQDCPYRSDAIDWSEDLSTALLLIYSLECLARAFVERQSYLCNPWNSLDFATVLVGWSGKVFTTTLNITFLRSFRLMKIARSSRLVLAVPELYLLLAGLLASLRAIFFGGLLLLFCLFLWSLVAVETLHPVTASVARERCERCPQAFANVWQALLTLFQHTVARDDWAEISLPAVEAAPWTAVVFFAIMVSVSIGVLNVFLVVVLECAMQTFEADRVQKVSNKELERAAQIEELARQCYNLDASARGRLSVDVLARAYEANGALRVAMDRLQLRQPELEMLCRHLDEENLGEVSYKDLCQHIAGFDRDPLMTQSLVQYSVLDLRRLLLQVLASPRAWENWTPSAVPREPTAEAPRAQAPGHGMGPPLRPAAAPTAMGRLEELHAELQPLLGKAEALLSEALDSYRVDVDGPGGASRGDHNARCANLREAFALQRVQTERLEEMLGGVVHRLAQRCGGAEGRTEFL